MVTPLNRNQIWIWQEGYPINLYKVIIPFLYPLKTSENQRFSKVFRECRIATFTAQKNEIFHKDFYSKCDQICNKLQIWSHLRETSLMENFIFFEVVDLQ